MTPKQRKALEEVLSDAYDPHLNGLQKTTIAMVEEALAEPEQEPVMIYHGRHTIDCGEFGAHDMEMLKLIPAGTKLYTSPQPREWKELSEEQSVSIFKQLSQPIEKNGFKTRYITEPNFPRIEKALSAALRAKNGFPE